MSPPTPSSTIARKELVLGFKPAAAGFESATFGTLAGLGGGEDGDDSEDGQSSAPAVEGEVVEGLGGACSGAQAGMIIGRAIREAFLNPEAFFLLLPRGGLASAAADGGGATPSTAVVGVGAVLFFVARGGAGAGFSLPKLFPLASRSAAWYFCIASAAAPGGARFLSSVLAGELPQTHLYAG